MQNTGSAEFRYLETKIMTATPEELTLIIFDVLIMSSTKAVDKLTNSLNDIQGIHDDLRRAQRALALLMGSLNFEIGGDLAQSLFKVYEYWHHELVLANMQKAAERVTRLLPDFKAYRETWAEAHRIVRAQSANAAVGARPATSGFAAVG
jgi:flagellar protein FliS